MNNKVLSKDIKKLMYVRYYTHIGKGYLHPDALETSKDFWWSCLLGDHDTLLVTKVDDQICFELWPPKTLGNQGNIEEFESVEGTDENTA